MKYVITNDLVGGITHIESFLINTCFQTDGFRVEAFPDSIFSQVLNLNYF
jgi:hypothetical protein